MIDNAKGGAEVSPQVDLDPDIFEYLKSMAEPFVDTPNTVLRRLLNLEPIDRVGTSGAAVASASPSSQRRRRGANATRRNATKFPPRKRTRAAPGTLLPEDRYEQPLLRALADAGGQAPYRDVVNAVGRELKDDLLPADWETLNSGAVRWRSRLQFVRLRLIERGYLDKEAPRGVWGITDAGRAALKEGLDS